MLVVLTKSTFIKIRLGLAHLNYPRCHSHTKQTDAPLCEVCNEEETVHHYIFEYQ